MTKSQTRLAERSFVGADSAGSSPQHSPHNGSSVHEVSPASGQPDLPRYGNGTRGRISLRKEITHLREQIITSRLDLREQRVEMRQQHERVRDLEVQLLQRWKVNEGRDDQESIRLLHEDLCAALDILGPMDDDFDEKEDRLDTLEYDLEAKERRFYKQHAPTSREASPGSLPTRHSSVSSRSDTSDAHLGNDYAPGFSSPQYQYYSRLGDAKIVRERLMELEAQKTQYLDIERNRGALSIPSFQENIDFLSNYDHEYAVHSEELAKIEKDLQSLGFRAGMFKPDDFPYSSDPTSSSESLYIKSISRQRSSFTEPARPRRSGSSSQEILRRKSEADVWNIPDDRPSSRERINQWIFERLEVSRIEKAQHRAILNDPGLTEGVWWELVLQYWQLDRAAQSSADSSRHVSGTATSVRPQALQGSLDVAADDALIFADSSEDEDSIPNDGLPVASLTWPLEDRAKKLIDEFKYLDLATCRGPHEKRSSVSSC